MTIPKNTKRAKNAIENATEIKCYALSNHFRGEPLHEKPLVHGGPIVNGMHTKLVEISQSEFLARELAMRHAKLVAGENGWYTIQCHSNLWFTFKVKAEEKKNDATRTTGKETGKTPGVGGQS